MVRGKTIVYTLGGLTAAYFLYRFYKKGNSATRLRFIADGISISKGKILFTLKIINGGNAAINLTSIVGDLIYNGNVIGVVSNQTPTQIAANSEKRIKFKITPDLTGAGMALYKFLTASKEEKKDINFTFKGTVNAEGILFDFEENYKF